MKKPLAILICVALAFNISGYFMVFSLLRFQAREVASEKIMAKSSKNDFTRLVFCKADTALLLKWYHAGEFRFAGEMYDIAFREYSADSVTYYCHKDEEERDLLAGLEKHSAYSDIPVTRSFNTLLSFLFAGYSLPAVSNPGEPGYFVTGWMDHYFSNYIPYKPETLAPPPRGSF